MKQSDYYLYIVPQTGKVYKTRDFNRSLEKQLCQKYGRIFAISGYSRAAKIVTLVENPYEESLTTQHGWKELRLDIDLQLYDGCREVTPEEIAVTEKDMAEGIRCSLLQTPINK
jgi:hypothetical protein